MRVSVTVIIILNLSFVYMFSVYLLVTNSVVVCPRYAHVSILDVHVYNNYQMMFYFLCKQQKDAYINGI